MNVRKILRGYLVFALAVTSAGFLWQNPEVKLYTSNNFASVLNVFEGLSDTSNYSSYEYKPYASMFNVDNVKTAEDKIVVPRTKNYKLLSFEIKNDPVNSFTLAGIQGVDLMSFLIKTEDKAAYFDDITMKAHGVDAEMIEAVYLVAPEGVIAEGKAKDEYFSFNNLNYKIAANSLVNIKVKLDLKAEINPGDRIRMDIEKPEDMNLKVNGEAFNISPQYPVEGKYLTIIDPRPWGPKERQK
jgi:hypothetical protein